jgi:hypothetical protein
VSRLADMRQRPQSELDRAPEALKLALERWQVFVTKATVPEWDGSETPPVAVRSRGPSPSSTQFRALGVAGVRERAKRIGRDWVRSEMGRVPFEKYRVRV